MVWSAGQLLYGGRYIIERQLGAGGFGITYRAKDKQGNLVVIKTLKDEVLTDPSRATFLAKYQQDFRDEALRLSLCRHPHIVQMHNSFHEGQLPCIAMEYVEGEDLWKHVNRKGVVSETIALHYIQQIGDALKIVHQKGLLHRDVKPQNIMVRAGKPEVVLIDFGIAREFIPDVIVTHTQVLSNGFAPIEQYAERAKRGEYTDVYALAATLYYLLTGTIPTAAFVRAAKIELEPPQQLNSAISDRVNQAIIAGMAFEPEERPQSVQEWLELFEFDSLSLVQDSCGLLQVAELSVTTSSMTQLQLSLGGRRILWVDDDLAGKAYQVAELQKMGIEMTPAVSTSEAMRLLTSGNIVFDAVISDMGRQEEGEKRPFAGLSLVQSIREAGMTLPVFVYTSGWNIARTHEEVLAAGANGITNSAEKLFKWLRQCLSQSLLTPHLNETEPVASADHPNSEINIAQLQTHVINPHPNLNDPTLLDTQVMLPSQKLNLGVGIDYSHLEDLLTAQKWKEADRETASLMLNISGRKQEGKLHPEDIEKFPCIDLHTLDQLWTKYSNGRFGLSVQKRVWQLVGGNIKADYPTFCMFGDSVGWRVKGNPRGDWLFWSDLNFSLNAPMGHLPSLYAGWVAGWVFEGIGGGWYQIISSLALRLESCRFLLVNELNSGVEVDYTQLRELLSAGRWREANEECYRKMLEATGRVEEGWLRIEDIENFDCTDLHTINQLWMKYSNGHFGFSVQQRIYEESLEETNSEETIWERFSEQVGWRVQNQWCYSDDLCFSIHAPAGHLPVLVGVELRLMWKQGMAALASRLQICNTQLNRLRGQEIHHDS